MSRLPVVYSPNYDFRLPGLSFLHPFDGRKFSRAWNILSSSPEVSSRISPIRVNSEIAESELLLAHESAYLRSLQSSSTIAKGLEVPLLRYLPARLLDYTLLRPMRFGTAGTVSAAKAALGCGAAINLSGGFHHAKPARCEGFCFYSDIAVAIKTLRRDGLLAKDSQILYVDLDVHQGNGICHQFLNDPSIFIFDVYNADLYPAAIDMEARTRIDCDLPITTGMKGDAYMSMLRESLPVFIDAILRQGQIAMAFYVAGTDVLEGDRLGRVALTPQDILARDLFVARVCLERQIPFVFALGGGYTNQSFKLIADSITAISRDMTS